jgi:RNA polymerase sigma-70 factor (ECF subfamily)
MTKQADHIYIKEILAGKTEAYSFLVHKYQNMVFTMVVKMLRNTEEAEEVAQDVFVKAYKALPKFKGEAKFSTWIYRIAYNTALDAIKKRSRLVYSDIIDEINEGDLGTMQDALSYIEEKERKELINNALMQLPEDDVAIISLYYFEELPLKEIAKVVNQSLSNVKVKLFRGRKKLLGILRKSLDSETLAIYEREGSR